LTYHARHREIEEGSIGGSEGAFILQELDAAYGNKPSFGEEVEFGDNSIAWEDSEW